MDPDFQFTQILIQDFFKQPAIKHRLQLISEYDITGWEIWLQVEFACFINNYNGIGDWYRECPYTIDQRHTTTRQKMAIDFAFRRKRTAKDRYIALELKQNLNTTQCIHNMFKDVEKVWKMKSTEDDIRSMWCLGLHPTSNEATVNRLISKYADQFECELSDDCIYYQGIEDTDWGFTLF